MIKYRSTRKLMLVWLICEYCHKPYLIKFCKSELSKYCSRSCRDFGRYNDTNLIHQRSECLKNTHTNPEFAKNHRKRSSDRLKQAHNNPNSELIKNNRKAIKAQWKNPDFLKAFSKGFTRIKPGSNHNSFISKIQYDFYSALVPYLYDDFICEFYINVGNTDIDLIYHKKWIRVDIIHKPSKVIIEVDGREHNYYKTVEYDNCRDKVLTIKGYQVLRIKNKEVINVKTKKQAMLRVLRTIIKRENAKSYNI